MDERRKDDAVKFAADMYDAVGAVWLETFGEHVHVGKSASCGTRPCDLVALHTRHKHY